MLPLIKIRMKYLWRYKLRIFWSYCLFQLIAFIISILILILTKAKFPKKKTITTIRPKIIENFYEEEFFNSHYYTGGFLDALKGTVFLANNLDDKNFLPDFIKNETGINVNCFLEKDDIKDSYFNIIILENKKGKYKFKLIQNETREYYINNNYYSYHYSKHFFYLENKDFKKSIDLFYVNDLIDYYYYDYYYYYYSKYNQEEYAYFLDIQILLSNYLIFKEKHLYPYKTLKLSVGSNLYPIFTDFNKDFNKNEASAICFSGVISFFFSLLTYFFNLEMINEKEKKLDIFLEKKGVTKYSYFCSWIITFCILISFSFITFFIFSISILIIFKFGFVFAFIINILLYIINLLCISLFFYSYISSMKTGFIVIKIYSFISPILGLFLAFLPHIKFLCVISCFIPQINFIFCTRTIFKLQTFRDLSWEKLWLNANKMSYGECIIMYIADIIIYFGLFFIKVTEGKIILIIYNKIKNKTIREIPNNIQENPINDNILKIENISNNKKGLNNINLELFPNEIFCLFGGNGTGKTTLLNLISGNEIPDNGNIIFNGKSIIKDKAFINKNINICEQEDIFFEYLTLYEYIQYMSEIKNNKLLIEDIDKVIEILNLNKNRNDLCKTLSEGEKRKLTLSLSLIGENKIILLDEPTRGLDPISKKNVWDYLKEYKNNKIILIGTYFLDEVEYLADKIGIISEGNIEYLGTISQIRENYPKEIIINIGEMITPGINSDISTLIKENDPTLLIKENMIYIDQDNKNIENVINTLEKYSINYYINSNNLKSIFLKMQSKNSVFQEEINKEINEKIAKFIIKENSSGFCKNNGSKFSILIKFLFYLEKNIVLFIVELLYILFITYLYIFVFSKKILNINTKDLNLIKILEENPIYIYEYQKNYFKNSYAYKISKSINFKKIKNEPYNIANFINQVYENSFANIAKGSISIKKNNDSLEAYNTYIYSDFNGYLFANTMMIFSAFLKNEYNIDASILYEITEKNSYEDKFNLGKIFGLSILLSFFCFLIILTGIIYDLLNKKENNFINNFAYLSRISKWKISLIYSCYYFFKLILYSILLVIPIYHIHKYAGYILLYYILFSISSLIFAYFLSCFLPKEDRGIKFLYIGFFIIILICGSIVYIFYVASRKTKINNYLNRFLDGKYRFTYLDITPITSIGFALVHLLIPDFYLNISIYMDQIINQSINAIFYSILLILLKMNICEKIHYLKIEFCHKKYKKCKKVKKEGETSIPKNEIINSNSEDKKLEYFKSSTNETLSHRGSSLDITSKSLKIKKDNIIIKIEGIDLYYFCCKKFLKNILFKYNLEIRENEKLGLLEPNGSGKTLLFKTIINEISYDRGYIYIFGKKNQQEYNKIENNIIYCPQLSNEFDYIKVKDIIQFFLDIKSNPPEIELICKIFDLNGCIDSQFIDLSFSDKKKLIFALSIMDKLFFSQKQKLLLLDNPLNGIDLMSRKIIWRNINGLIQNQKGNINLSKENYIISNQDDQYDYTMILATDLIEEAKEVCTTIKSEFDSSSSQEEDKNDEYNLYIYFKNSSIDNVMLNDRIFDEIKKFEGFNEHKDFIDKNREIEPYLNILYEFIKDNIYFCSEFVLFHITEDYCFEFKVKFAYKKDFFLGLINMKKKYNILFEIKPLELISEKKLAPS